MFQQNYQDWTPVVLRKTPAKPKPSPIMTDAKRHSSSVPKASTGDTEPPKLVGKVLGRQIEQARASKKITRA